MGLLDYFKRKPKAEAMGEPVAEGGVTGVRPSFAASVAAGLTPFRLAEILRSCDDGDIEAFMTLAEEMEERDPHYASVLGQRKRAVSGVVPSVIPASDSAFDKEVADWVETHIAQHDDFPTLVEHLLDAIGKGFSVVEIGWDTSNEWLPAEFRDRPQRFFQFDRETGRELRLRSEDDLENGVELQPARFIRHVSRLKSGHVFRGGVARVAAFSWMCKAYTMKDWVAFVETYGLPFRMGRYGTEATKEDVAKLYSAVANLGTDAAAVLPKHMEIELVENKSGGGAQPIFENFARYIDEQLSKLVLGQTMTTDDGSSQSQAEVHQEVKHDIVKADALSVSKAIQRDLVVPAVFFNFGPIDAFPTLRIVVEETEDVAAWVKSVVALAQVGVTFKMSEARRKLRTSDPETGDEVFGGGKAPATPAQLARAQAPHLARSTGTGDIVDELRDEMMTDWEPVMDELLEPMTRAIAEAGSFEEALANLDAIETLPSSRMIDGLVKGMFLARVAGDVEDG